MDDRGRLHIPLPNGKEFVGKTFEETKLKRDELKDAGSGGNRHERRADKALKKRERKHHAA